jgi:hypothetical protein
MDEICSTTENERKAYTACLSENLKGSGHLIDTDADGKL